MPKVRFNLKPGTGLIQLKFRFRKGGLPFVYSFDQHCTHDRWNHAAMRAKGGAKNPQDAYLNDMLNRLESETLARYRQWLNDPEADALTDADLRTHLDTTVMRKGVKAAPTLAAHIEAKMATYKKEGTRENWLKTLKVIQRYQIDRRRTIKLADVNDTFRLDFEKWCYEPGQNFAITTTGQHLSVIKSTVRDAADKELTKENKTVHKGKYMPKMPQTDKNCLHESEVQQLFEFDFSAMPANFEGCTPERLQRMADVMVVACETGLRCSDLDKIKPESLRSFKGMSFLNIFTKKSEKGVDIPLSPRAADILERYGYQLPSRQRSELLTTGRKVLKVVGIERTVTLLESSGGQVRATTGRVCDHFSAHWTRRTFATETYLRDPSLLPAIQRIMGHSSPQQTLDYMNLDGRLTAEHFARTVQMQAGQLRAVK